MFQEVQEVQPVRSIKTHTQYSKSNKVLSILRRSWCIFLDSNFVVNAATETPLNEPPRTQLYSEGIPPATANLRTGDE